MVLPYVKPQHKLKVEMAIVECCLTVCQQEGDHCDKVIRPRPGIMGSLTWSA